MMNKECYFCEEQAVFQTTVTLSLPICGSPKCILNYHTKRQEYFTFPKAGDVAWNIKTDTLAVVIGANARELTIVGSQKWESNKNWRPTDYPSRCLSSEIIKRFKV